MFPKVYSKNEHECDLYKWPLKVSHKGSMKVARKVNLEVNQKVTLKWDGHMLPVKIWKPYVRWLKAI